jgi:deoxycytidylate deaminase
MSQIDRGFDAAFAASELSDAPRAGLRMGAALFSGPRLLTLGANLYERSHPKSEYRALENFTRSTHCEHQALLRWQHYDKSKRLTLFVARRRHDGTVGNSRPCKNCMSLCRALGIRKVWFYEHAVRMEVMP